jgi:CRP-like cAMP-binding protein
MASVQARTKEIPGLTRPATRRENLLLSKLPASERLRLIARCEPVELAVDDVLCEQQHKPVRHVYFPLSGFMSHVVTLEGRSGIEVRLVGVEGMFGISLMFGVNVSGRVRVHGAGYALRLEAAQFLRELKCSPALTQTLNRYLLVIASQLIQTAACNRFHRLPARLARWLLMARDRANSHEFYLTHELASSILGARREGVTEAAKLLQTRKMIRYHRGHVTIINAPALEAATCKCYAATTQVYAEIMS